MRVHVPVILVVLVLSVVESVDAVFVVLCDFAEPVCRHGHANVPQLHALIFAVAKNIPAITLAINVCQALNVSHKGTSLSIISHASSVPDLDRCVVGARVNDVRRPLVGKADGIDIVLVTGNVVQNSSGFDIIDDEGVGTGASDKFSPVARKSDGPDTKGATAAPERKPRMSIPVVKLESVGLTLVFGIGRCYRDDALNRSIRQPAVVWAQGGIRQRPLAKGKVCSLVELPVVGIGSVVHAYVEVLAAGEEEVSIV